MSCTEQQWAPNIHVNNTEVKDTQGSGKEAHAVTDIFDINMQKCSILKINIPLFLYVIFIHLFCIYLLLQGDILKDVQIDCRLTFRNSSPVHWVTTQISEYEICNCN